MYKVLIVDDEFLARKLLQGYVEKMPELEIAGSCANAFEAFKVIKEEHIDILLLDIHMPDLNGVDFARTCKDVPCIIFTTAYSEYALDSYEVSATDYLLKPIAMPRFMEAIKKAEDKLMAMNALSSSTPTAQTYDIAGTANVAISGATQSSDADYIMVKADYRLYKINHADLMYIEGQHEYVSFYTSGKRITALYSLKALEDVLPSDQFVRVHKSYIVSIRHIQEIEQMSVTVAGTKVPIGGNYREALLKKLGV
ncbi:MAG: response regulator transcription factor [Bacteroidales bacterium]|nr:response regulator transcription factor [Candidatus Liminaster caballi]